MSKFPQDLIAAAKASQQATGVPACITLAQWAIESHWGEKETGDFNDWGMKWEPECPYPFKICATEEEVNGVKVPTTAKFISFPSLIAAVQYHGRELVDPHGPYRKALPFIRQWRIYLHQIAPIYATDSHYEALVTEIISENHLESV